MQSQQKKPLAIVMATDDKAAFAAGCALLSLKQNSPLLFKKADIIIYYQNLSQQNRKALRSTIIPALKLRRSKSKPFIGFKKLEATILSSWAIAKPDFLNFKGFGFKIALDRPRHT